MTAPSGLQKVAKFYVPAFHEPGPGLEVMVNKAAFDQLTPDLKAIVEAAALAASSETCMPTSSTTISRPSSPWSPRTR